MFPLEFPVLVNVSFACVYVFNICIYIFVSRWL